MASECVLHVCLSLRREIHALLSSTHFNGQLVSVYRVPPFLVPGPALGAEATRLNSQECWVCQRAC